MLERLRALRERAGISQKSLADQIGVSQQSINKYENHNIEPDIETLIRMAAFFDTSVDYLIGYSDIDHKLERLQPFDLNAEESALMRGFRRLGPRQRHAVSTVVQSYLDG